MSDGWFAGTDPENVDAATTSILVGSADEPAEWPAQAVDAGFADDEDDYYSLLHDATTNAAREAVRERETADDQQLKRSIRAMDDCERTANELAERVVEWAASRYDDRGTGVEYAKRVAQRTPADAFDEQLVSLATQVEALTDEAADLRELIERTAPNVAPNLSALAGPVLATRLIALAGGLESLAKKPSGTVQVLGAEDALFAHLRGNAPPPKHGVIYTHEAVRGTHPDHRGSAARALAGKLTIAARVDHYSGEVRPVLATELADRMETIRSRSTGGDDA